MTIMITQWLCPSRHASFGIPWDSDQISETEVLEEGESYFSPGILNRKCHLCGSEDIGPETGKSRFRTLEECIQAMQSVSEDQMITRIWYERLKDQEKN